jgi:hypothetical protein
MCGTNPVSSIIHICSCLALLLTFPLWCTAFAPNTIQQIPDCDAGFGLRIFVMLFCLFVIRRLLYGANGRDLISVFRVAGMILACALALGWSPVASGHTIWVQASGIAVPIGAGSLAVWFFSGGHVGQMPPTRQVIRVVGGWMLLIAVNHLLMNPDAPGMAALMDVAIIAAALHAPMPAAFPRAGLSQASLVAVRGAESVGFAIWVALCLQQGENLPLLLPVMIAVVTLLLPWNERLAHNRA